MPRNDSDAWPLYFAGRACKGRVRTIPAGHLFDVQDKPSLRLWGVAFGVLDAADARTSFADLLVPEQGGRKNGYVVMLDVGNYETEQEIRERGLTYEQAKRYLAARDAAPTSAVA